jgi:DNA-binding NarL/FixJ family response regulator
VGIVLVSHNGTPVYFNSEAIRVLSFRGRSKDRPNMTDILPAEIRSMLLSFWTSDGAPIATHVTSGRRRYLCQLLALNPAAGAPYRRIAALVLERENGGAPNISGVAEQFNLTQREQQTVGLLTLGLTSKEIANRMDVSPNTVKTFFRLVMTKMGVNTRAGIVGKIARM